MPHRQRAERSIPEPIRAFWLLNGILGVICAIVIGANRYILHLGRGVHWQPYTSPFLPWGHFADFWAFHDRFDHYHTTAFYSTTGGSIFSYPAPLSLLYAFFFIPHHNQHTFFTVVTTVPILALLYLLRRELVSRGIANWQATVFVISTFLFSYPFWFEYELGNIEICVFLIVAFGLLAWVRGQGYVAAALLGAAGSMKVFPFVYLALFLSRRQYKQFACGILTAVVLYPLSVWMACPSFSVALPGIRASSHAMGANFLPKWDWVLANFDHSLWGVYKQAMHLLGFSNERPMGELSVYTFATAVVGLALYFFVIRRLPLLNQLLCLCIASLLLPPLSNDYTLLYLYIPWALLIISTIQDEQRGFARPGVWAAFILLALLLSPESEIIIGRAAIAGQFKALILLVLLYVGVRFPFELHTEERISEPASVTVP